MFQIVLLLPRKFKHPKASHYREASGGRMCAFLVVLWKQMLKLNVAGGARCLSGINTLEKKDWEATLDTEEVGEDLAKPVGSSEVNTAH